MNFYEKFQNSLIRIKLTQADLEKMLLNQLLKFRKLTSINNIFISHNRYEPRVIKKAIGNLRFDTVRSSDDM